MLTNDDTLRYTTQTYAYLSQYWPMQRLASLAGTPRACSRPPSPSPRTNPTLLMLGSLMFVAQLDSRQTGPQNLPASTEGRSSTTSRLEVLGT